MNDSYPASFVIEIDREALTKYFRLQSLIGWVTALLFFGGAFGFLRAVPVADKHVSVREATLTFAGGIGKGVGLGLLLALVIYALFLHRRAARRAAYLELAVEGPFLRVRQQTYSRNNIQQSPTFTHGTSDRKLHFRSIIDYTVTQNFLMRRCGIHALEMTTPAAGLASILVIPGVKDCLKVRDTLSEIDRLRENQ